MEANLIHLSGCLDEQLSRDTPRGGAFSRALISAVKEDQPADYDALHAGIKRRLTRYRQTSQMNKEGPTATEFKAEKPFQLKYNVGRDDEVENALDDLENYV
jgi:hypothetical protein